MENKTQIPVPDVNVKALESVFGKMYITNVKNRLQELNSPTDNDKKRWVWELIQNAKDSIAKNPNRSGVNIIIEVDGDVVRFKHDGDPFTPEARYGLLYKYSEDKENQESTGRFGTGFLTTHCLSKVVTIESNMYKDDERTKLCGFSVTMYRDGIIASELLEGLEKMKNSETYYAETFDWTTFTYHVSSDSGREAIKLGVENFRENIAQTMLFCNEISSIYLVDNGKTTAIIRKPKLPLGDDLYISEFQIIGNESISRRFIHTSFSEYDEELSKRYRSTRQIRLDVAVEVDSENNIVCNEGKTSFFCVMPLVGTETQLNEPLIINSPDFEPDHERQSLLLNGITRNEEKNVLTENGINRTIYRHVFPLYDKIVKYLVDNKYGQLYHLANGLNRIKTHENLDQEWYQSSVISSYREVLGRYPIVSAYDGSGNKLLRECIFVRELKEEDENKLFLLSQGLFPHLVVNDNHQWIRNLWEDGQFILNTEQLCGIIEKIEEWESSYTNSDWLGIWYNDFLQFILNYDESLLKKYALLPNMNGELLKIDNDNFKQGEHINSTIISLLGRLGKDVKPTLLHEGITAVSLSSKYNSQSFSADVNNLTKLIIEDNSVTNKVEKLLPLLSIVPDNFEKYGQDFINHRNAFFEICRKLHGLDNAQFVCDNSLLEGAWKNVDEWFVEHVLKTIESYGNLDKLPQGLDAIWLNSTLKLLHVTPEKLNTYRTLPNQDGEFVYQQLLFQDGGVPEALKNNIFGSVSMAYKPILLHKDIDAVYFSIIQKKDISTFASELKERYKRFTAQFPNGFNFRGCYHYYPQGLLDALALYLLSLVPANTHSDLYKHQKSLYGLSKMFLLGQTYEEQPLPYDSIELWQLTNEYVIDCLCEKITSFASIEETQKQLGNVGEAKVFELLNSLYSIIQYLNKPYKTLCIFPNQNGIFHKYEDLKREDGNIHDVLKNIICKLVPAEEEYREILMDKRCIIQPQVYLTLANAYSLIDTKVFEQYAEPSNWRKEGFVEAVHQLLEIWKEESNGSYNIDNFPKTKPIEDSIMLNVVWKKERRQKLMEVSNMFSESQLQVMAGENMVQLSELATKVENLKNENELLRKKLAELGIVDLGENSALLGVGMNGGELATPEQIAENDEAKKLVLDKLQSNGFNVSNANLEYSVINGVTRKGVEYPLVVKSCKNQEHRIWINPGEWKQLFKPNSMLWLHFGGGVIAPIKTYELFTYQDKLTLSFDSVNLINDDKVDKIMEVLHYFNSVKLDLAALNPDKRRGERLKEFLFDDNNESNSDLEDDVII